MIMSRFNFCMWMSNCYSTICWKDYLCCAVLLFAFVRDQLTIFMSIYFCSINLFVCSFEMTHCCDCCSFIILRLGRLHLPKLFFSIMLAILCPLPLHINVSSLPVSAEMTHWNFDWDCIESIDQLWKSGLIDSIESSRHEYFSIWHFGILLWYFSEFCTFPLMILYIYFVWFISI